jgi:hypothetical protein
MENLMTEYPPELPPGAAFNLDPIIQRMVEDPTFLSHCPYSEEDKAVLRKLESQIEQIEEEAELGPDDKWSRLEKESNALFKSLTEMGTTLTSRDNTEQMAYFRTATSLLDKIVGIQERTANLKQISRFHDTVLMVMEDVLDAGQRTKVLDQLRKSINPEV